MRARFKKSDQGTKPMGATRTRIEDGIAKLDTLKEHLQPATDKFTKAIQSSMSENYAYSGAEISLWLT